MSFCYSNLLTTHHLFQKKAQVPTLAHRALGICHLISLTSSLTLFLLLTPPWSIYSSNVASTVLPEERRCPPAWTSSSFANFESLLKRQLAMETFCLELRMLLTLCVFKILLIAFLLPAGTQTFARGQTFPSFTHSCILGTQSNVWLKA